MHCYSQDNITSVACSINMKYFYPLYPLVCIKRRNAWNGNIYVYVPSLQLSRCLRREVQTQKSVLQTFMLKTKKGACTNKPRDKKSVSVPDAAATAPVPDAPQTPVSAQGPLLVFVIPTSRDNHSFLCMFCYRSYAVRICHEGLCTFM